jgi:hypothetical protein
MYFLAWLYLIFISGFLFGAWGSSIAFSAYLVIKLYWAVFKTRNWVNPIFFFEVSLLLATLANMKIISIFESGVLLRSYQYAIPGFFDEAAWVWAIGNFFIIESYGRKPRFQLPRLEWNLSGEKKLQLLFWLSIALVFRRFWMLFTLPGALDSIFQLLPLLGILMYARLAEFRASLGLFWRALILTVLATLQAVLFAYLRIEMIIPGLVFFLGTLSGARSLWVLRAPRFYPLYAFLLLFSIFFATFGATRSGLGYGIQRFARLQQAQAEERESVVIRETHLSAFERTSNIGQLSAVIGLVRNNGYYLGEASAPLLTALIPRFLWPGKPKIALGVWFALEIGAALPTEAGWYNTSINMTIPGQLYLDFSWLGLIIGCWLTGVFLRMLWETTNFVHRPLNFTGSLFAGYLLYTCFLGFGADLQILVTMLAIYLMILALDRLLRIHFARRRQPHLPRAADWAAGSHSKGGV